MSWNIQISAKKKGEKRFWCVIGYNDGKIYPWMTDTRKYFGQHPTRRKTRMTKKEVFGLIDVIKKDIEEQPVRVFSDWVWFFVYEQKLKNETGWSLYIKHSY